MESSDSAIGRSRFPTQGRFFPWGDRHDPAFSAMMESRSKGVSGRPSVMERIGLFPADESPYGVRDMAGVIRNWTGSETTAKTMIAKGGAWSFPSAWCRAAHRGGDDRTDVLGIVGIRLVAPLRRR